MKKTIIINENQRKRLLEARSDTFSLWVLSDIDDVEAKYRYCVKELGNPFSEGSSRVVFTLSDNLVLKLSYGKGKAGNAQNEAEYKVYETTKSKYVTRVLLHGKDFDWIVSESVVPAEPIDFEKIFNIPFRHTYSQGSKTGYDARETVGYDKYFDSIVPRGKISILSMGDILEYIHYEVVIDDEWYDEEYEEVIENNEWLKGFREFVVNYNISDFTSISNFGIVNRNGVETLILLDSGMNDEVWENNYAF